MKILITGASGLVGSHFVENNDDSNKILAPVQNELDITDEKSVKKFFEDNKVNAVINFAAYTNVSLAEEQRDNKDGSCWIINVNGADNIIKNLPKDCYLIHISTDVVFSGSASDPGPYTEKHMPEEEPNLLSWYGWTKREAERLVTNHIKNSAILRISNPIRVNYSPKFDYVRKILNLYDNNKLFPMFDDQFLSLSYINEVTQILKILLSNRRNGIFHASSSNLFTPFKLANFLIEKARGIKNTVPPISIVPFLKENPSRYPQYGGLDVKITQKELGFNFMTWEEIIEDLVKQL